jgi:hypothetical protein
MNIPWGPYRPDVGGANSGIAKQANNVLPQAAGSGIGYGPMPALVTAAGAEALSGAPRGIISIQKASGAYAVFAATATKIETMDSAYQWSDVETGRTVTSGDDVSFAYFGKYLLNSDTTDGFKAYDVEVGGTNSAVSGAPGARALFSCNNVVFALGTSANNRRMQSSAIGDHTNWTTNGADGKTFEDGGALIGGRDLKNGAAVIFQENAIRLVQFGGGAALYTIAKLADGRGAVSDRSIVSFDGMAFYVATDGFYKYTLGGGNEPIGAEKVNRWLATQVAASGYEAIQGALDPFQKIVWWRLTANLLVGYDWQLNEFITSSVSTSALTRIATPGVTLDSLTTSYLDSMTEALDSRFYMGGVPLFGALDATYKFATFAGSPLEATLQTNDIALPESQLVSWCSPDSDASSSTIALGVSDSRSTTLTFKTPATRRTSGRVPLRGRGKVIGFRETIPAGASWNYSNGVNDIVAAGGGVR